MIQEPHHKPDDKGESKKHDLNNRQERRFSVPNTGSTCTETDDLNMRHHKITKFLYFISYYHLSKRQPIECVNILTRFTYI